MGRVVAKGVLPTRRGPPDLSCRAAGRRAGSSSASGRGRPFLDRTIAVGQTLLVSGPVRFYHGRQMAPREYVILADADSDADPLAAGKVLPVYPATEGLSHKVIRSLIDRHLDAADRACRTTSSRAAAAESRPAGAARRASGGASAGDSRRRRSGAGGAWRSTSCSISS